MLLVMLQNSQKSTCARVSFLIKLQHQTCNFIKKRVRHRCFPVNFAKFLRTSFLQNTSVWLLLALGVKKVKRAIFILKIYQVRLEQVNLLVYWPYWLCFNQKQKNNISYKILANWLFLDLLLSAFFLKKKKEMKQNKLIQITATKKNLSFL